MSTCCAAVVSFVFYQTPQTQQMRGETPTPSGQNRYYSHLCFTTPHQLGQLLCTISGYNTVKIQFLSLPIPESFWVGGVQWIFSAHLRVL